METKKYMDEKEKLRLGQELRDLANQLNIKISEADEYSLKVKVVQGEPYGEGNPHVTLYTTQTHIY